GRCYSSRTRRRRPARSAPYFIRSTPMTAPSPSWTPPYTLEERIKYALIPPRLYMWRLIRKHLKKGEAELKLLPQFVARDRIAIDIGANKGVYTHLLSRICQGVEAFEPNPKIYRILKRALPVNVVAHQVALSNRTGTAELIVPMYGGGFSNQTASLNPRKRNDGARSIQVAQRTLDSYGFSNVGFIKIDVEGFERAVLEGARETISRERPVLQIEIEEQHTGEPVAQSVEYIVNMGYDAFFARDGALHSFSEFDEAANRQLIKTAGYINNFIFKPEDPGGA
ncbi:MAG: FkbM family methyltransferase, partial [Rhodospirillaceae bacterium]